MSQICTDSDPLLVLRARTRPAHRRVESTSPVLRLMAQDVTKPDALNFLLLSCRYHAAVENHLGQHLLASGLYRPRTPHLTATLLAHGLTPPPPASVRMPDHQPDSLLGTLYVLEGASVGSSVVDKHLRTRLGEPTMSRIDFFRAFGRDSQTHWKQVTQALRDGLTGRPDATERAVGAAIMVFEGIETVFRQTVQTAPLATTPTKQIGQDQPQFLG